MMDKFFEATVQVTPPSPRDDIIRMAREANFYESEIGGNEDGFVHFATLVAAAEREILADWMRQHGFSTGQAYTTESLLDRLGTEMVENTDAAVLAEREACAKVCEDEIKRVKPIYSVTAENALKAIRARGNT